MAIIVTDSESDAIRFEAGTKWVIDDVERLHIVGDNGNIASYNRSAWRTVIKSQTISADAQFAVAKVLAEREGDGWVFEPPKMDGVTRSGTSSQVYLELAQKVLIVAACAETGTPAAEDSEA